MFDVRQEITAGNTLVREAIQSQNFVTGTAGWQIAANGNAEFNNVTVRGKFITGPPGSKHIEINGVDSPNGIAFYTGDVAELFPSILQPQTEANDIGIQFTSPETAADSLGSSLKLYTHKLSAGNSEAVLTSQGLVALIANRELLLENAATGDTLDFDSIAGTRFNGTHFDILDPTLPGNLGVTVVGGYMQPLNLNTWQSITALGAAFVNSWTDVAGSRFGAFKDATARVTLRGLVISGTNVTITTLPVGWRPSSNLEFTMRAGTNVSAVAVSTAGVLTVTANAAAAEASGIHLDCISYPTA
jgi:hypothetical protein